MAASQLPERRAGAVEAKIRYLRPELKGTIPVIGSAETRRAATVVMDVTIADARPPMEAGELSLDTNGFLLVEHASRCPDFRDDAVVRRIYYEECIDLIRRATGAEAAFVTEHLVRTETPTSFSDGYARYVHLDYDDALGAYAPQLWARKHKMSAEAATEAYDFAFYNVWQPFDREVLQDPLALIDARTVRPDDVQRYAVAFRPVPPGGVQPTATIVSSNPEHRWYFFPRMRPSEAILFKQLDTRNSTGSRQCPHVSFKDPAVPAGVPGRRSIEVRVLAAFPRRTGIATGAAARL
mmetsp:Transcript_128734/g.286837  ORF Transcript_128734/g.286837 Transcript_128734/m.286837 type:complete len:295 (+) Transcript_128734:3-887(+)